MNATTNLARTSRSTQDPADDPVLYQTPVSSVVPKGLYLLAHYQDPMKCMAFSFVWSFFCPGNYAGLPESCRCMQGKYTENALGHWRAVQNVIREHSDDGLSPFPPTVITNNVHWNNEAEPPRIWLSLPDGWKAETSLIELAQPEVPESRELRTVDFELSAGDAILDPARRPQD